MKITWYGHACFKIETAEGSLVLDPYAPGSVPGLSLPALMADKVLCSHGHSDHNYTEAVTLSGREPALRISLIPCYHDGERGRLRGENLVSVIEAEGLRFAHLGDLGHMLAPSQLAALGRVDVLLVPVGGFYTIDARQAQALCTALRPGIVVPMHYRAGSCGLSNVAPVADFLRLRSDVVFADSSCFDPKTLPAPVTLVLKIADSALIK